MAPATYPRVHPSRRLAPPGWELSACANRSTSRASSPLLFGLAPRGVCLASGITAGAVGSYPTFSPLPALRTIRRHPEGFPPGYQRVALRRRYILCGTFRSARAAPDSRPATTCAPPGVTRRIAHSAFADSVSGLSSRPAARAARPAIIQLTRHNYYTASHFSLNCVVAQLSSA
jgi:hypothetical protein